MNPKRWTHGIAVLTVLLGGALAGYVATTQTAVDAADHNDPPERVNGAVMEDATEPDDIADLYAWHGDGKLRVALTYAGLADPMEGQMGVFSRDVLYTVHIDTDEDQVDDHTIDVRFGQNEAGAWGVQVEGMPGTTEAVVGEVNTMLDAGGGEMVFAGIRDDAFFFDLEGFRSTVMMGSLQFASIVDGAPVDFYEGQNSTAIVLEMDLTDVLSGDDTTMQVWASTARFGG